MTRNGSSLIAFKVGASYAPGAGAAMIAGHIDALTARLKPVSKKPDKAGYVQLGVGPYAGALNETWWDRDLSIGGRVVVRDPQTGKTSVKLVKLDWPSELPGPRARCMQLTVYAVLQSRESRRWHPTLASA